MWNFLTYVLIAAGIVLLAFVLMVLHMTKTEAKEEVSDIERAQERYKHKRKTDKIE